MTDNDADWHFGQFMGYLGENASKKAKKQTKEKLTVIFLM
jgi:hypothetical protein